MFSESKHQTTTILLSLIAATILIVVPASAQQFATIDPPGSTGTYPGGINNLGQVVGAYFDGSGVEHCFLLTSGVYSTIDYPGAIATACAGINNLGQIVGSYVDSSQLQHGFSLTSGTFKTIDDPAFSQGNFLAQVSDVGVIAGDGIDSLGAFHGFTLTNNVFKTINYPSANFTEILDMSFNGAELVGAYSLPSFPAQTTQGFTLLNGVFTSVTYPGSASSVLNGVTNIGQLVGTYTLPNQSGSHVFLMNGSSTTSIDFPGAISTGAANINDLGQVVGGYTDSSNVTHGFLMSNGPYAYAPVRSANSVAVFDITTKVQLAPILVGSGPVGIAVSSNGPLAYAANYSGNSVSAINTSNNTVIATVPVGSSPLGVAITPNGSFAYVANNFSNSVSVISTASNTVVATVPVGSIPSFVAITPDGNFAYVTNGASTSVSVISTATNTVVANVALGAGQEGLAITPDGKSVYVTVPGTNSVAVISTATNTVVSTVTVGAAPVRVSITPDGTAAYVSNQNSDLVSVINIPSNTVVTNVVVGTTPYGSASTPDGAFDWVIDSASGQISVISTATNAVVATLPFAGGSDIAIASAPPSPPQPIILPLSPTQPNVFNYGTHSFTVQYPPGSGFSGINMKTVAVQMSQAEFQQRVASTQYANATCIVYNGTGGNCVDYQVTCQDNNGNTIACPSEVSPTIDVETGFDTSQAIVNPGYLTTPIGENQWTNIFTGFSDPLIKGKTQGFSEFVGVDLGVSNPQGQANMKVYAPKVCSTSVANPTTTCRGTLPVYILLTSVVNGSPVTGAHAGMSEVQITDAKGNPVQGTPITKNNAFQATSTPGEYAYRINISKFPPGTYDVTVYGDSFASQTFRVTLVK